MIVTRVLSIAVVKLAATVMSFVPFLALSAHRQACERRKSGTVIWYT